MKMYNQMKLFAIILFCIFGFFSKASKGYFGFYPGMVIDGAEIKRTTMNLAYGGHLLKDNYIGSFETGIAIIGRERDPIMALQLKYEYDFLNNNNEWDFGLDTSVMLGGVGGKKIMLNLIYELNAFAQKYLTDRVSVLFRVGIFYLSPLSDFKVSQGNIKPFTSLGVRYHLK